MDKKILRAAVLFTVDTVVGTVVSFREGVPGEPLGRIITWPILQDPAGRLLGGSGVSAPWLMPAACVVAALAGPDKRWPRRTVTAVATALTIGQLIEPVTWGHRSRQPQVLGMVGLNLLSAAVLFASVRYTSKGREITKQIDATFSPSTAQPA